ncbi:MAG TPA: hypothetical protein VJ978_14335 [Nitriliruptoraceae bacterium]|nr:hypothetical protein [Nitriliruptoraceae bacterium]
MTNHDDNPTMLADRVAVELQTMAAELDIVDRSPAAAVRIGQRRRRQAMLATGGLAAAAVVVVVAVFLAIQPLGTQPDVAQVPTTAPPGAAATVPVIPPLTDDEVTQRAVAANQVIAGAAPDDPIHAAVIDDATVTIDEVDAAFRAAQACAAELGADVERAANFNMVGDTDAPGVRDCELRHYRSFRDVMLQLVIPSDAQRAAIDALDLCDGLVSDGNECATRTEAVIDQVVDANTAQVGRDPVLVTPIDPAASPAPGDEQAVRPAITSDELDRRLTAVQDAFAGMSDDVPVVAALADGVVDEDELTQALQLANDCSTAAGGTTATRGAHIGDLESTGEAGPQAILDECVSQHWLSMLQAFTDLYEPTTAQLVSLTGCDSDDDTCAATTESQMDLILRANLATAQDLADDSG